MSRIRFGVNLNTRVPILYPEQYPVSALLKLAERVEQQGYDSVWVGDSLTNTPRLESTVTLGALAQRTHRVKLGTSALISPLRNIFWLTSSWSSLDMISTGRTILVVCVGNPASGEFQAAGAPLAQRGKILEEQIQIMRKLWIEDNVTFHGDHHDFEHVSVQPKPLQKPCPPIWIASNPHSGNVSPLLRERMLRRVARLGDGWMTVVATPQQFEQNWKTVLAFAKDYGRQRSDICPAYQVTLNISDSRNKAVAEATDFLNRYYGTSYVSLEKTFWNVDPFGTADDAAKKIDALASVGVETLILRFASPDQEAQVERFSREVLPSF